MQSLFPRLIPLKVCVGLALAGCLMACERQSTEPAAGPVCSPTCQANQRCDASGCVCLPGFTDCDGLAENGCEWAGRCVCRHGQREICYDGPDGTSGVGQCRQGQRTCTGGSWSFCEGQVLPLDERCADGLDNDCDGSVDEDEDRDGDGFGRCSGDCCDDERQCADPAAVNPGAFDYPNNGTDDDCDGDENVSDETMCAQSAILHGATALQLASGMDLCQPTDELSTAWGLISAELTQANPNSQPYDTQVAVLEGFGAGRQAPRRGEGLAVLSTGLARGVGDPDYLGDRSISATDGHVPAPQDYLDAHEGRLQSNPVCPAAQLQVYDSVRLALRIRVPTNAQGLRFDFRFWSREYPDFLCTEYNDFFLVRLRSSHPAIPEDRNISYDAQGNPVTVNSAFFTTCQALACDDPIQWGLRPIRDRDDDGCVDSLQCDEQGTCAGLQGACPDGADDLEAYTLDVRNAGATAWLTTSAPVIPGEVIELEFLLWDSSDGNLDSLVLLDNFAWMTPEPPLDTKR